MIIRSLLKRDDNSEGEYYSLFVSFDSYDSSDDPKDKIKELNKLKNMITDTINKEINRIKVNMK